MTDYNFITDRLATGAHPGDADGVKQLLAVGVTHILNCWGEVDESPLMAGLPVTYLWCPTLDDGAPKGPEWFGPGLAFALPALAQPGAKLYSHCAAGINRGPSMAFAIMFALGWNAVDAEAMIRKVRPQVGLAYKNDAIRVVPTLRY
jgi:dual specificity phosphatase 3